MTTLLKPVEIIYPVAATLKKYGYGFGPAALADDPLEDWKALLEAQGGVCPICENFPKTGRFNTDHDHVRGWKNMPPERRRQYVRGLLDYWCNTTYVGRAITAQKALNVFVYLDSYATRRP